MKVLGAFGIETQVTDAPRDTAPSFADARGEGEDARPAPRAWYILHH